MLQKNLPSHNILILDSGFGGLSVANEIRANQCQHNIYYLADSATFPYGDKSGAWVKERVCSLVAEALKRWQIDLVVIACNTASTLVLDELRSQFSLPIVGVVPAIKPAAKISENGNIAVLATQGTTERDYTQKLIADFAATKQVSLIPTPGLVELAESSLIQPITEQMLGVLKHQLGPALSSSPFDTVVLACTHFPLLKAELKREFTTIKYWVDSGTAIAARVQFLLNNTIPLSGGTRGRTCNNKSGQAGFYSTQENALSEYTKTRITSLMGASEFGFFML